jgi:hypothetical protein
MGILGIEPNRFAVIRDGAVSLTFDLVRQSPIIEGLRKIRLEFDRPAEVGNGTVELALIL